MILTDIVFSFEKVFMRSKWAVLKIAPAIQLARGKYEKRQLLFEYHAECGSCCYYYFASCFNISRVMFLALRFCFC